MALLESVVEILYIVIYTKSTCSLTNRPLVWCFSLLGVLLYSYGSGGEGGGDLQQQYTNHNPRAPPYTTPPPARPSCCRLLR